MGVFISYILFWVLILVGGFVLQKVGGALAAFLANVWEQRSRSSAASAAKAEDRRYTVIVVLVLLAGLGIAWLDQKFYPNARDPECLGNWDKAACP